MFSNWSVIFRTERGYNSVYDGRPPGALVG